MPQICEHMVTTADFTTFQKQLREEVADVTQQLRVYMTETINGRIDVLNSVNAALQNVSMKQICSQPYRISDLAPCTEKGRQQ